MTPNAQRKKVQTFYEAIARRKVRAGYTLAAKLCALPEDDNDCIPRKAVMDLVFQWRMEIDKAGKAK